MCAERPVARVHWKLAALAAVSFLAWWLIHRWWFMSGDDYLLVTQAGDVAGRFSFSDWLGFLAHEWGEINGRTSDSLLRLVLRPGEWFYPLFGPVMLTVTGLAFGAWLLSTRERGDRLWCVPVGLLIIPLVLWLDPRFSGDAVLWTAGAMNYVFPLGAAALGISVLLRVLEGREVSWLLVGGAAAVLFLTDTLQEIVSGALVAVAFVVIVTARGRLVPKAWVMVGTSLVAFALHMCAPGLWKRSTRVANDFGAGTQFEQLLHAVALSATTLFNRTGWFWMILAGLLVWVGLTRRRRVLPLLAAGGIAGMSVLSARYIHRAPWDDVSGGQLPPQLLLPAAALVVVIPVTFLLVWFALGQLRDELGWVPVVTWAAFVGSTLFVFGAGVSGARVHFPPAVLLLLTVLALLLSLTRHLPDSPRRAFLGSLVAFMALPSAIWADQAWVGLRTNHEAVQQEVIAPLLAAEPGAEVVVPTSLPVPSMSYGFAFLMPRYEESLKIYFNLPDDISITNS